MKTIPVLKKVFLLFLVFSFCFLPKIFAEIPAVASLKKIEGNVQVLLRESGKEMLGREGQLLKNGDLIITGIGAKAGIIFRDGSEIRIFQNTRFLIKEAIEEQGKERSFKYNFMLKIGSFWGRFIQGKQRTVLHTPSATIGIKGTTVRLDEREGKTSVSLTSGLISVKNDEEKVELTAGQMIKGMSLRGSIKDRIQNITKKLSLKADSTKIVFAEKNKPTVVYFTLQLVDQKTKQNLNQSGPVLLQSNLDKFVFPKRIYLNKRGYTRVRVIVNSLEKKDYATDGRAKIYALMDGDNFFDIGGSQIVMTYDVPKEVPTIRIDANTDKVRKK